MPVLLMVLLCVARYYFGDQVGFYLAYLNALTCWLLAPAAASSFLLWALGPTGLADRTGRGGQALHTNSQQFMSE
jgi:hypothetical protein